MFTKIIVLLFMLTILISLGSALFQLVYGHSEDNKLVKALTWRIALSITLFLFLMLAFAVGWIQPHGL